MEYPAGFMTPNIIVDLSILSWFFAQFAKLVIHLVMHREFDITKMVSSGGMPSSHSSFVCSGVASIGMLHGVDSPIFGLATIFALVVMYDACHVRRSAGEQAKFLNDLVKNWQGVTPQSMENGIKVILGHTPAQVLTGAAVGLVTGYVGIAYFT